MAKHTNVKTFRDLLVWQKAMILVTDTYTLSKSFPQEESYGLTSQIRRCAVSIQSNIAESYSRNSNSELIRFLNISTGSLYELQTQIEISYNLNYIQKGDFETLHESTREIERMLSSFTRKLINKKTSMT